MRGRGRLVTTRPIWRSRRLALGLLLALRFPLPFGLRVRSANDSLYPLPE